MSSNASSATLTPSRKAAPASAYRHTVELTPAADAPDRMPVIVSMDVAGGRFFSVFSIPLRAQAAGAPIH